LSIGIVKAASANRPTGRPGGFRSSDERPLSPLELCSPALHRQLIGETGSARPLVFERNADFAERASVSPHSEGWWQCKLTGTFAFAILCVMTDLAPELARLSPRQRLDLIESLWESLDEKDVPVTDAQRAELDRRIVGFDQDAAESIPWDQLRAELRQRR